jgi:hypothetical protein
MILSQQLLELREYLSRHVLSGEHSERYPAQHLGLRSDRRTDRDNKT